MIPVDFSSKKSSEDAPVFGVEETEQAVAGNEPGAELESGNGVDDDSTSTVKDAFKLFKSFGDAGISIQKLMGSAIDIFNNLPSFSVGDLGDLAQKADVVAKSLLALANTLEQENDLLKTLKEEGGPVLKGVVNIIESYAGAIDALDGNSADEVMTMGKQWGSLNTRAYVYMKKCADIALSIEKADLKPPISSADCFKVAAIYYKDNETTIGWDAVQHNDGVMSRNNARELAGANAHQHAGQADYDYAYKNRVKLWYLSHQHILDTFFPGKYPEAFSRDPVQERAEQAERAAKRDE